MAIQHVQDGVRICDSKATFMSFIFILVTEDQCSSPVDTVKQDGRASSSKAKARKGKSSAPPKPEPKPATVR